MTTDTEMRKEKKEIQNICEKMSRQTLGKLGEEAAANYLAGKGYTIIKRNFRCRRGEIDIIAADNAGELVFTEVKTRSGMFFGLPCEAVNYKKYNHIVSAMNFFLLQNQQYKDARLRIDIIEVFWNRQSIRINHMENIVRERGTRGCCQR